MVETKLYVRYDTKEERIEGWQSRRQAYTDWRFTDEGSEWVAIKANSQANRCFICLTPLTSTIHVDHIFPLYLGGTNAIPNLCVTHADCNMRKGVKVYMTHKEACKRRQLFNDIRRGVMAYRRTKEESEYKPSKKSIKRIALAKQYLTEEEMEQIQIRTPQQAARDKRRAAKEAAKRAAKN